jgi:hypothetical protein
MVAVMAIVPVQAVAVALPAAVVPEQATAIVLVQAAAASPVLPPVL